MKTLLGGKGANCAEMAKVGLSVPPGFTITTQASFINDFIYRMIEANHQCCS
jgi:phosphoenolpyruvate synthase/pyruvate phosphate dikinase